MADKVLIRKIGYDTSLNIVSYGLPILMLQFVVFPYIAKIWGAVEYGLMLTLTAVINVAAEMVGGTLANVRLIREEEYKKKGLLGDYKRLLILFSVIILIIILLLFIICFKQNIYCLILLASFYLLFTFRSYFIVSYRIDLKYKSVFINNIFLCIGYAIGIEIAVLLHHWAFVYIMGYVMAITHLFFTNDIWKEPIKKTGLYDSTRNKYISLSGAYLIGNGMNYFDRIFLMATIGATGVGYYYISGVFGKVLNLLTAPINMVMLSYLSKKNHISVREIVMSIAILLGIVLVFILAANQFAMSIINILYPESANEVKPFVLICTVATVLTACTSFYKTLSMRYNTGKYVFLVEVIYIIIYIGLALAFTKNWGIKGFCVSIIVAAIIRMLFFVFALLRKSHV